MDIDLEYSVKAFIKANIRRIQIALALAISRFKPDGLTAVQFAANIQARVRLKYLNCEISKSIDQSQFGDEKMLFLQQKQLLTRLRGILPQSFIERPTVTNTFQLLTGYSNDVFIFGETLETDIEDEDGRLVNHHEFNLRFIEAMIQLKNIIESSSYVSASRLQDIFLKFPYHSGYNRKEIHNDSYNSKLFMSTLSIATNPNHTVNNGNMLLPNGILGYIIHSSDTNILLLQCVKAILNRLEHNLLTDNTTLLKTTIQNWKGSLLEDSLKVVFQLVNNTTGNGQRKNEYYKACLVFIHKIIEHLFSNDSLNMHMAWQLRCCILTEFGNCKYLCIEFLDYLIREVRKMCKKFKNDNKMKTQTLYCSPSEGEKIFYLFYMIETLLKKWKKFSLFNKNSNQRPPEFRTATVVDLWRRSWHTPNDDKLSSMPDENDDERIWEWREILEDVIIDFSENCSFMAFYTWKCLDLLNSSLGYDVYNGHNS
ncbi:hypothetical protein C0J52_07171 [Blattella germanica]|nr:hypothetical protein C0J52_07171 [Blattella germanica]